jgi:hypothetical protein
VSADDQAEKSRVHGKTKKGMSSALSADMGVIPARTLSLTHAGRNLQECMREPEALVPFSCEGALADGMSTSSASDCPGTMLFFDVVLCRL